MKYKATLTALFLFLIIHCHAATYVDGNTGVDASGYGISSLPYKTVSFAVQAAPTSR